MANDSTDRELRAAVSAAMTELERSEEYNRSRREVTKGRDAPDERPGPLEFDERGFPVVRPLPGLLRRARTLFDG